MSVGFSGIRNSCSEGRQPPWHGRCFQQRGSRTSPKSIGHNWWGGRDPKLAPRPCHEYRLLLMFAGQGTMRKLSRKSITQEGASCSRPYIMCFYKHRSCSVQCGRQPTIYRRRFVFRIKCVLAWCQRQRRHSRALGPNLLWLRGMEQWHRHADQLNNCRWRNRRQGLLPAKCGAWRVIHLFQQHIRGKLSS